jgi:hypothetical protein
MNKSRRRIGRPVYSGLALIEPPRRGVLERALDFSTDAAKSSSEESRVPPFASPVNDDPASPKLQSPETGGANTFRAAVESYSALPYTNSLREHEQRGWLRYEADRDFFFVASRGEA